MVNSVSNAIVGGLNPLSTVSQRGALSTLPPVSIDPDHDGDVHGVGSGSQSSASISGFGQLLSQLQQLQAKNPAKFQQVMSDIVTKLQTAAQQQGNTPQGQYLSQLASKFEAAAQSGNLSQLQGGHGHHGHHGHHTYSANGTSTPSSSGSSSQTGASADASATGIQQLFASISAEVSQALAG
jgi:hypothetical protein